MFFICGIDTRDKALGYARQLVCPCCGRLGRFEVYVMYTCLSLFFVPLFKWGRRYYARASCCGAVCEIDSALGRRIEHGEPVELTAADLRPTGAHTPRRCPSCGAQVDEGFHFCPHCGRPI